MRKRLKAAQLNTNSQSTLASPRSFTFFSGPICFNRPNGFSTSQRLLKLISYPGCRVVRSSMALRRLFSLPDEGRRSIQLVRFFPSGDAQALVSQLRAGSDPLGGRRESLIAAGHEDIDRNSW